MKTKIFAAIAVIMAILVSGCIGFAGYSSEHSGEAETTSLEENISVIVEETKLNISEELVENNVGLVDKSFSKCAYNKGVYDMMPAKILKYENQKGISGPLKADDRPLSYFTSESTELVIKDELFYTEYKFGEKMFNINLHVFPDIANYNKYKLMVFDKKENPVAVQSFSDPYGIRGATVIQYSRVWEDGQKSQNAYILLEGTNKAMFMSFSSQIDKFEAKNIIVSYANTICPKS